MSSVNKDELLIFDYKGGLSLTQVAERYGITVYSARARIKKAGALRSTLDGVRLAAKQGRLGQHNIGVTRHISEEQRAKISASRLRWADAGNAAGVSRKASGYVEYTRGPHKGRSVHVVEMENRLGRRLLPDECVHHIDGDRSNNDPSNLALVTRAGHSRLHRREDMLLGSVRERGKDGRFC